MAGEATVDFLLIVWVILGFVVLGGILAWAILRNRKIERERDRTEHRHPERDAYRR